MLDWLSKLMLTRVSGFCASLQLLSRCKASMIPTISPLWRVCSVSGPRCSCADCCLGPSTYITAAPPIWPWKPDPFEYARTLLASILLLKANAASLLASIRVVMFGRKLGGLLVGWILSIPFGFILVRWKRTWKLVQCLLTKQRAALLTSGRSRCLSGIVDSLAAARLQC